jgi:uncharacterized protein
MTRSGQPRVIKQKSKITNHKLLMTTPENPRLPVPPFDRDTAMKKVRLAEDAWNSAV